ncbi:MAG: enoyl-CoA hydratase/isomerase family protein [Jatrophihabitans sp.]|uniref:enoyl-CoA hydratase/isomerase family protein n=1 Tax=Jatrophihabitans sp. TaxID=1932789 RepID=UPI003F7FD01B
MSQLVHTRQDGGVLAVRLHRPEARNALSLELTHELAAAIEGASPDTGAIALLADGDHFCVGGDVRAMAAADDPAAMVRELADGLHRVTRAIAAAAPVVCGAQGWAAGAGFSLALSTDVVLAADDASFQPAYPGIGATPDGGLTWTLPRAIGERRARSLLLRNAVVPAVEACVLGIVDRLVPAAELEAAVLEQAAALAGAARQALRGTKRLLTASASATLTDQLDAEAASIAERIASAEGQEGVAAFIGRRRPDFGGLSDVPA